jgi:hypothetical protein
VTTIPSGGTGARLEALRTALGDPLPPHARARILRMLDRLELVCAQNAAKAETGAPLYFRQLWQWHHATDSG